MISEVFACLLLAGCALAQIYGDDQATGEQQLAPNYAHHGYGNDIYESARAEPYDFGFQSTDEFGTIMNRQESSDSNGAVRGSYGYTDPFGVFRHVDYVADEFGFRAEVKSNEPGMGTASPANVAIYAEPPPAGVIIERSYYNPHQHGQGGQLGQASGQQPARRNPSGSSGSNANRQVRPSGQYASGANSRLSSSTSGSRTAVYPYTQPQQNAFSSNALSSSSYPNTVSNQYAANAAVAAGGSSSSGAASSSNANQYTSGSSEYSASGSTYQTSASAYPSRNPYGSQGYTTLTANQYGSSVGSSQASSAQKPIVAKPYDGPTYKIGNPHVTEFRKADKQQTGTYLLPTVVTTGGAPTTLVKHIHAYPAQPAA